MPWKAHVQLLHLGLKYTTITILNSVHAALCIATVIIGVVFAIQNFMEPSGFSESFHRFQEMREARPLYDALVFVIQFYMPLLTLLIVSTNFMVVKDSIEGRYCPLYLQKLTTSSEDLAQAEKLKYRQMHRSGSGDTMDLESAISSASDLEMGLNDDGKEGKNEKSNGGDETVSTESGRSTSTHGNSTPTAAASPDDHHNLALRKQSLDPQTQEKLVRFAEKLCNNKNISSDSIGADSGAYCPDDLFLTTRKLSHKQQAKLFFQIYTDLNLMGQITCIVYGTIPLFQTVVSLSRFGHKFDYIVAAKPELHTLTTGMRKSTPKQSPAVPHAVAAKF
jgi:hypothetical protein